MSASNASTAGIGVGIVGLGWGVRVQLPLLRLIGFRVLGVCGRRAEETAATAAKLDIPFHTTSVDELCARADIHLILVSTPPASHLSAALSVLKHGKHLLLEKPFVLNSAEAQTLHTAACEARKQRKNGYAPLFLVDHELRTLPALKLCRSLVLDSAVSVGQVHQVTFIHFGPLAISPTFNWWYDRKSAGGIWNAIASHAIDLISFITGARCTAVSANLSSVSKQIPDEAGKLHAVTADQIANAQLTFKNTSGHTFPALVTLSCVHGGYHKQKQLIIGGEHGTIIWDLETTKTSFFPGNAAATEAAWKSADKFKVSAERLELAKTPNKAAGAPPAAAAAADSSTSSSSSGSISASLPVAEIQFASSVPTSLVNWPTSLPITGFTLGTYLLFQSLFHLLPKIQKGEEIPAEDLPLYADFVDGVFEQLALDAGISSSDAKGVQIEVENVFFKKEMSLDELEKTRTK